MIQEAGGEGVGGWGCRLVNCAIAAQVAPEKSCSSSVGLTHAAGPSCARLGPFGFAQGRLARAPVPTRALGLRLLVLGERVQEAGDYLLRQVVVRGKGQLVLFGAAGAEFL